MEISTRRLGESERTRRCYQRCCSRLRTQLGQERFRLKLLLSKVFMLTSVEGQEQELANELSESLEWHTGTMKVPSKRAWAMALDKQRLLAENVCVDYLPKMTLASY